MQDIKIAPSGNVNRSLLYVLAKYFSIIRNYVLSVSSQRKCNFHHQNTLLDAFRMNSRNVIGRNPLIVIPLLTNQDLTPMLKYRTLSRDNSFHFSKHPFLLHNNIT